MPFITEEIWQHLPYDGESIMISNWPEYCEEYHLLKKKTDGINNGCNKEYRNIRAEINVAPSKKAKIYVVTEDTETFEKGKKF